MNNQHKKIKGYRDLSQEEINLMNEVKAHAEQTKVLIDKVQALRTEQNHSLNNTIELTIDGITQEDIHESRACLAHAKRELQVGFMWFVRGIALPTTF